MTDAQSFYESNGGCQCHRCPPCSFCTLLTEIEGDLLYSGGLDALEKYWVEHSDEE